MQNKLSINKFVTLNNGVNIPTIGYGTYKASEDEVLYSVINAINNGYRLIDCASFYQNQVAVGKAIKASRINRNELFITSKVELFENNNPCGTSEISVIISGF